MRSALLLAALALHGCAAAAGRATEEEQPVALFDALVAWLRAHPAG